MAWFGGFTLETYNRIPGDYEVLTVGTAVGKLSTTKIKPATGPFARMMARAAMISSEDGDLRFRLDGGLPTADNGHYLVAGDSLVMSGYQSLLKFQAIRTGDTDSTLRVTYFY
jgi:hypothetical protein